MTFFKPKKGFHTSEAKGMKVEGFLKTPKKCGFIPRAFFHTSFDRYESAFSIGEFHTFHTFHTLFIRLSYYIGYVGIWGNIWGK